MLRAAGNTFMMRECPTPTTQTELCQAVRAKIAPAEKGGLPAELVSEYCKVYGIDIGDASMKMFTKDVTICNTACYIITPKNATRCVLLVYGYFDHAAAWRKLVPRLLKDNCMLILYDLKGHGFSDGDRADIADFNEYLEQMRAIVDFASEFKMPLHAVAHSTGAGILADLLLHDKEHATKLSSCVLMAPLLHSNHWGISRFGRNILRGDVESVKRSFKKNSSDKS